MQRVTGHAESVTGVMRDVKPAAEVVMPAAAAAPAEVVVVMPGVDVVHPPAASPSRARRAAADAGVIPCVLSGHIAISLL